MSVGSFWRRVVRTRVPPVPVLLFMALLGGVSPGSGQDGGSLVPGAHVRITAPTAGLEAVVGTLRSASDSMLVVDLFIDLPMARLDVEIDRSSVTKLEVSNGKRRRAVKGMWIGALVGAGVGALEWAGALNAECTGSACFDGPALVAVDAVSGALSGLLIGALITTEKWRPVGGFETGVSILPTINRHGAGVSFALRRKR
jgi:hypothetical protein